MLRRIKSGILVVIMAVGFFLLPGSANVAQAVTYVYDELNRLTQITYDDGTVITYTYDEVGNRLQEQITVP